MAEAWKGRIAGAAEMGGRIAELVFHWGFQSDFTNEMDMEYRTGRAGSKDIHVLAS